MDAQSANKEKSRKLILVIVLVILIVLFIAIIGFIIYFYRKSVNPSPSPSPGPTPAPSPSPSPSPLPCGQLPPNFSLPGFTKTDQIRCDQSGPCQYCYTSNSAGQVIGFNGNWVNLVGGITTKDPIYTLPIPTNICDNTNCTSGWKVKCCNDNMAIAPGVGLTSDQVTSTCSQPSSLCYPCASGSSPITLGGATVNGTGGTLYICAG